MDHFGKCTYQFPLRGKASDQYLYSETYCIIFILVYLKNSAANVVLTEDGNRRNGAYKDGLLNPRY